jgi:hypothetical protein
MGTLNGCPPRDLDGDGIIDLEDDCPDRDGQGSPTAARCLTVTATAFPMWWTSAQTGAVKVKPTAAHYSIATTTASSM